MKKAAMETSDLSQPQGLPTGWLEAPRPRKTVFPGDFVSILTADMGWMSCSTYRFA